MSGPEGLRELARLHGIAADFHDIWGKHHQVPDATLVALLAEFGVDAATPHAASAAVAARERERWREVLPPISVVREGAAPWKLRVNLPAQRDTGTLAWQVEEEDGARHAGEFAPADLPCLERNDPFVARELKLPVAIGRGYHRIALLQAGSVLAEAQLVVAPQTCYRPLAIQDDGRVWGAAVQVYALRSGRNWGVGDFTDLRTLLEQWAHRGASIVGVNPLHALFPHNPQHASPYSPSSRLFLNVLYIDVEAVEDLRECEEVANEVFSAPFQARLQKLRESPLVDYAAVAELKFAVLERLYVHFRDRHLARSSARAKAFRAFQAQGGDHLWRHALFEALQEHFHREDWNVWGWPAWPEPFRDPDSHDVARFAKDQLVRIELYQYLQWQAELQLSQVGKRSFDLELGVGLYEDLAVSIDRGGAEAWANQDLYAVTASVGAPPDDFNLAGQNWGLPPLRPERLREVAYEPFIATLRQNMRHAGALRIDHVMGLYRLYWIPEGKSPAEGAYVHYPFDDLLGIVALESHRNQCMVIGEDLGTVPDDVRTALGAHGILSYRLFFFERNGNGDFRPPAEYPAEALVAASTHDLPTLAGYWEGSDLLLRDQLGLIPEAQRESRIVERAQDRARLLLAMEREELLPHGATVNPVSVPHMTPEFVRNINLYLARTPAKVLVVQLEDVLGMIDQVNLPATTDEHPNWRRKLVLDLERIGDDERFVALANALAGLRALALAARRRRLRAPVAHIPRATYRLQLNQQFTFTQAAELVPYLAALGVSHIYCSPYLRARPGSTHGYDIIDHTALNPEIGTRDEFEHLVAVLRAHGMGQILDMVPNHMGVMGADNAWWLDVLENGPASVYSGFFDIDWQPVNVSLLNRVLLPVLGDHYGLVLERGELKLAFDAPSGTFSVFYFEHRFPVDPREYPQILERAFRTLGPADLAHPVADELSSLIAAFGHLPGRENTAPAPIAERHRDKELHKRRLAWLVREAPAMLEAIERAVRVMNGVPGEGTSFEALHELLEQQAYRVAYWRVASDEINYRRFFDINELAGLRMEDEAVFEATHRLVLDLLVEGKVDGLRLDHPDGLYDPAQYFRRLQERYAQHAGIDVRPPEDGRPARPLYVLVEKIAAGHEHVPESWAVHGTTGYRFATVVNGLFVDGTARNKLDRIYRAFVGEDFELDEVIYRGKRTTMRAALASELTVLATALLRIARADRRTRDYTFNTLRQALTEVVACFPVYRTYIAEGGPSQQDRRQIDWAVAHAKRRGRAADTSIFDFVRAALLGRGPKNASPEYAAQFRSFAMKFQQVTAPVTAKGVEDTAFYIYNRLAALNEVGGDPNLFGFTVSAFHGASADRTARWPHTMLATSTHDNKRAEDVRARIDVISEMPAAWRLLLRRWGRMNRARKRAVDRSPAPSRNDEYLLYQTLLGTFPLEPLDEAGLAAYRERIERYMVKAIREAKVHSSWINVSEPYESAAVEFVRQLLVWREGNLFLDDLAAQVRSVGWFGMLNSLSMSLIKLASPGVPDIYQGTEIWDLSLVDPDNRRPVDYARRKAMLARMTGLLPGESAARLAREMAGDPDDGRAKLWAISRALDLRRHYPQLFEQGEYIPLAAAGARAEHVVAFARRHAGVVLIALAGRLWASLGAEPRVPPLGAHIWGDTSVDASLLARGATPVDALTKEPVPVRDDRILLGDAFANFPGALLLYNVA